MGIGGGRRAGRVLGPWSSDPLLPDPLDQQPISFLSRARARIEGTIYRLI